MKGGIIRMVIAPSGRADPGDPGAPQARATTPCIKGRPSLTVLRGRRPDRVLCIQGSPGGCFGEFPDWPRPVVIVR